MITTQCLYELDRIFEVFKEGKLSFERKIELVSGFRHEGHGFVELIGSGASSTVFRVIGPDQTYALKALQDIEMYKREVDALQRLSHPHIIGLKGLTTINRHYCLCLEHLPHVSLWDYIRTVPEGDFEDAVVLGIFTQLVSAVVHMHQNRVSHHDLNSRNIMIDPGSKQVKIIDFGLAVMVPYDSCMVEHGFGTPLYLPLEVLEGRPHDPRAVDVWGLGVIFVEMLIQNHPWGTAKTMVELARMMIQRSIHFRRQTSVQTNQLIDMMLTIDPVQRITIQKVEDMLKVYSEDVLVN